MMQINVRVREELVEVLDAVAGRLGLSREAVVRRALERYLEDFDDVALAAQRLSDPSDIVLEWDEIRGELLDSTGQSIR